MCAVTDQRTRPDRCPGVLRPWPADDGPLVRIRIPGGRLTGVQWRALAQASAAYGDGRLHLTSRANVQVRGVRDPDGFANALEAAGLLPSRAHDLIRNVLCSPLTGVIGGRADLRPVLTALDAAMLADARLAGLPGKFLVALDDGRGDVASGSYDLGCLALDRDRALLLVDGAGAEPLPLADVPSRIVELMHRFLDVRGAAWHVRELPTGATGLVGEPNDVRLPAYDVPGFGSRAPGVEHLPTDDGAVTAAAALAQTADEVVVTPWRSLLLIDTEETR
jgi:precorrin-3B synthase